MRGTTRASIVGSAPRLLLAIAVASGLLLSVGSAAASARCQGRYRDLALPEYDRLVVVYARRHLSCSSAARAGSAVADAYERGLPIRDYPPPPKGVPGGGGHTFHVRTRPYGTFTCRMTARGSDFVTARCRRGTRFVSFSSMNHWFLHGR
jgi:hypothetical protein